MKIYKEFEEVPILDFVRNSNCIKRTVKYLEENRVSKKFWDSFKGDVFRSFLLRHDELIKNAIIEKRKYYSYLYENCKYVIEKKKNGIASLAENVSKNPKLLMRCVDRQSHAYVGEVGFSSDCLSQLLSFNFYNKKELLLEDIITHIASKNDLYHCLPPIQNFSRLESESVAGIDLAMTSNVEARLLLPMFYYELYEDKLSDEFEFLLYVAVYQFIQKQKK